MSELPLPSTSRRQRLAIAVARAATTLLRRLGIGGGTTLPGHLALLIAPDLLRAMAGRFPDGIVLVSATNGKTTTTAILRSLLEQLPWSPQGVVGQPVATNASGANLPHGILASLLLAPDSSRLAVLEVDEAYLPSLVRILRPRLIVLGALFRDQLDRHGEVDALADRWRTMLAELDPATSVVLGADDPRLDALAPRRQPLLRFGIDDPDLPPATGTGDAGHCLRCGLPYRYEQRFYAHLGSYHCPAGDHRRGHLDVCATAVDLRDPAVVRFELQTASAAARVCLPLPGLHNVENALAAAAAALALGGEAEAIATALAGVRPAFGRGEQLQIDGRTVLLMLIKNPIAADRALATVAAAAAAAGEDSGHPSLLLALHDGDADSRDISWIWDIDLELLIPSPVFPPGRPVHLAGERAVELALRLHYAGLPVDDLRLHGPVTSAFDAVLASTPAGGNVVVLATYSPLLRLHRRLAARGATALFWSA